MQYIKTDFKTGSYSIYKTTEKNIEQIRIEYVHVQTG